MLGSPRSRTIFSPFGGSGSEVDSLSSVDSGGNDNRFVDNFVSKLLEDEVSGSNGAEKNGFGGLRDVFSMGTPPFWDKIDRKTNSVDLLTKEFSGVGIDSGNSRPLSSRWAQVSDPLPPRAITGAHSPCARFNDDSLRSHLKPVSTIPALMNPIGLPGNQVEARNPPPCVYPDPLDMPLLPPPEYLKNMPPPSSNPLPAPFLPELNEFSGESARSVKPSFSSSGGGKPITSRSWVACPKKAPGPIGAPVRPKMPYASPPLWLQVPPPPSHFYQPRSHQPPLPHLVLNPFTELQWRLDGCYEQFRNLEKERKRMESELIKLFPGKKCSANTANMSNIPRLPQNPSKVDRLVIDSLKEHARIVNLCGKMDRLRGFRPLNARVGRTCDSWVEAIRKVQLKRREEIVSVTGEAMHLGTGIPASPLTSLDEREVSMLAEAIGGLAFAITKMRTALWCAFQSTILSSQAVTNN